MKRYWPTDDRSVLSVRMSSLENWSPSTSATCFRRFAQDLKEQSKRVFLKDKSHHEMFFFVSDDGKAAVMPAPADIDRDQMVDQLRQKIRQDKIYGLVHISESWTYFRQKPGDHTMKQIVEGEIKVSELRPEDRDEVLVVMMESRDGARFMWMTPILRDGDKLSLGVTMSFDEPPGGRFAGLFEP